MLLKKLLEDFDLDNPPDNYNETDMEDIAAGIFRMAEERAYDASAEGGMNVTHDQIMASAKDIMRELERQVAGLIEQDFNNSNT